MQPLGTSPCGGSVVVIESHGSAGHLSKLLRCIRLFIPFGIPAEGLGGNSGSCECDCEVLAFQPECERQKGVWSATGRAS